MNSESPSCELLILVRCLWYSVSWLDFLMSWISFGGLDGFIVMKSVSNTPPSSSNSGTMDLSGCMDWMRIMDCDFGAIIVRSSDLSTLDILRAASDFSAQKRISWSYCSFICSLLSLMNLARLYSLWNTSGISKFFGIK
ncbi:Hypothetical_protein [Hexamita inflata]|uniref:Hypothetical_protein n=1 Tax=Hexamita inflata TaxID=28002 RepID=A0AA86Q323_9EUKA|nr:Hypothetical protein HINF_LOCUS38915 [Hexamita inflata]